MPLTFDTPFTIPDDVLVSMADGEAVLLKLGSESYFGLDPTGARLWELLRTTGSLQATFNAALAEFDVEAERFRSDFVEFLDALSTRGLIALARR